jgi:ribosomal protein S18 acetylase RimI-like enzyme
MRIDFRQAPGVSALPTGLAARPMSDELWPQVHHVVSEAFRDHYDSHPLPLELFRRDMVHETTDMSQWQLVFEGEECVAVCVGSNRFEPFALGYVDCLAVLRQYRGRGIAKYLLHEAFRRDHTAGFTGTSLHCDASNATGATQLYRGVGMQKDQQYAAWRLPLRG